MKLHNDKSLFSEIITRASEHPVNGGLGIKPQFIEKDYWITNSLSYLSKSQYKDTGIFKGGTSLSKAHAIGYRFSEDIDIAVIKIERLSDAKLKDTIRGIEKDMAKDLTTIDHPETSKGSRYRKSFHSYPLVTGKTDISVIPGQILLEINSFANPFPYQQKTIKSFAYDYLIAYGHKDIIKEFELEPFEVNVLDKRTTMTEKLVSLIRFSLADNPVQQLEAKIRHFYDLHYLYEDKECKEYLGGDEFVKNFLSLYNHDRELFDKPNGWNEKNLMDSPLFNDFHNLWEKLSNRYYRELPPLSYSLSIPTPDKIESSLIEMLAYIK